jgi:hypothetical protein
VEHRLYLVDGNQSCSWYAHHEHDWLPSTYERKTNEAATFFSTSPTRKWRTEKIAGPQGAMVCLGKA